jgi:outer membrane lipoprotein-sorting protein
MKTKAIKLVSLSIMTVMLLSACGSNDKSTLTDINSLSATEADAEKASNSEAMEGNISPEYIEKSDELNSEETGDALENESDAGNLVLKNGTWFILNGETSLGYISLYTDSSEGIFYDFQTNVGSVFSYDYSNNSFEIHFEDEEYSGELIQDDEDTYELVISDRESMLIEYVSEKSAEEFRFYTADELCSMALNYYTEKYDYRPSGVSYMDNADKTITIHIYDEIDGTSNVSVWYTVDRITTVGIEELSGEEVCLLDAEAYENADK